jgi:hypothetical protein
MLFTILAANGLALNLEKCVFAVSELDFLGHLISAASVQVNSRLRECFVSGMGEQIWSTGSHNIRL